MSTVQESKVESNFESKKVIDGIKGGGNDDDVGCDPRLSRAARHLWVHDALPYMKAYVDTGMVDSTTAKKYITDDPENNNISFWREWKELAERLKVSSSEKCRLHPNHDILWWQNQEEHQHPHYTSMSKFHFLLNRHHVYRKNNFILEHTKQQNNHLYSCGKCGKIFMSRYYLDIHILSHHHEDEKDNNHSLNQSECWGNLWCHANRGSRAMCERQALVLEPHYGPGSGGWSYSDSQKVYNQWQSQLTPCVEEDERERAKYCFQQLLQPCFSHVPILLDKLNEQVCKPTSSCKSILTTMLLQNQHQYSTTKTTSTTTTTTSNKRTTNTMALTSNRSMRYEEFLYSHPIIIIFFLLCLFYLLYLLFRSYYHNHQSMNKKVSLFNKVSKRKEQTTSDYLKKYFNRFIFKCFI